MGIPVQSCGLVHLHLPAHHYSITIVRFYVQIKCIVGGLLIMLLQILDHVEVTWWVSGAYPVFGTVVIDLSKGGGDLPLLKWKLIQMNKRTSRGSGVLASPSGGLQVFFWDIFPRIQLPLLPLFLNLLRVWWFRRKKKENRNFTDNYSGKLDARLWLCTFEFLFEAKVPKSKSVLTHSAKFMSIRYTDASCLWSSG